MATKKTAAPPVLLPLLVTTKQQGVFFGYAEEIPTDMATITLKDAQMCTYYAEDMKGVFGLGAKGPSRGCRIGPPVPSLTLFELSSVSETTKEAAEAWALQPWG